MFKKNSKEGDPASPQAPVPESVEAAPAAPSAETGCPPGDSTAPESGSPGVAETTEGAETDLAAPSGPADRAADLQAQLDQAQDRYLRLMAEFDNYKRRMAREYQRMAECASESLVQELIAVRENFLRALKTGDAGGTQVLEGMKLIFAKFDEVLTRAGLEDFCDSGDLFDPQLHDALMRMPHEQVPEGHIADVYEKGYRLKGRVVRHARVIVSSGRPQPSQKDVADGADSACE